MRSQTSREFRQLLEKAVAGDGRAFEELLDLYKPMLARYATVNGRLDEDLWQHISMQIARDLSDFKF